MVTENRQAATMRKAGVDCGDAAEGQQAPRNRLRYVFGGRLPTS
jgi:hypothetical protein